MNVQTRLAKRSRVHGFTLIELLIAVAITAVVSAMGYSGLTRVLAQTAHIDQQQRDLGQLQLGFAIIEQDIAAFAARPIRDELGGPVAAVRAASRANELEFTRRTDLLPGFGPPSGLERIEYHIRDNVLVRRVWSVLDRVPATTYSESSLFSDVSHFALAFFDNKEWSDYWPPSDNAVSLGSVPRAVRLTFDFPANKRVVRVFAVNEIGAGG